MTKRDLAGLRLLAGRQSCFAEGEEHHLFLHQSVLKLLSDQDLMRDLLRISLLYVPLGAFDREELAEVRALGELAIGRRTG